MIVTWPNWWKAIFGPRCGFTIWDRCIGDDCCSYRGHPLPHRTKVTLFMHALYWNESDGVQTTLCVREEDGRERRNFPYSGPGV